MTATSHESLHRGFFQAAAQSPNKTALYINEKPWSYSELATLSAELAQQLTQARLPKNGRVGLFLDRTVELYSALLAVLRFGSAYVPLDPNYPTERLNHIIATAQLDAIVCLSRADLPKLEGIQHTPCIEWNVGLQPTAQTVASGTTEPRTALDANVGPDDTAYVLFTSGSTGRPKGVVISHGNASAFVSWAVSHYQITDTDRMSGHSDLSFDLSVMDTFATWSAGATLYPLTDPFSRSMPGDFIAQHQLTLWFSVPSVLSSMAKIGQLSGQHLGSLRRMMFCGEPLPAALARQLMQAVPNLPVSNLYGPTEATVACSVFDLPGPPPEQWDALPIGWRTADTEIFVWSDENRVAKEGESGEILISGDQVSSGYWQNPEETAAKFGPDPRPGLAHRRCYKTGDIAVVTPEGPVFRGRKDFQIKFRGWRIELGDVENALNQLEYTLEAAVVLHSQGAKLTGFVRVKEASANADEILRQLKQLLPDYMVPTHIKLVEDFPRTLNGKIDRLQLADL